MLYAYLLLFYSSHDSKTWITFFTYFLNVIQKNHKSRVFSGFSKDVQTYSRTIMLLNSSSGQMV